MKESDKLAKEQHEILVFSAHWGLKVAAVFASISLIYCIISNNMNDFPEALLGSLFIGFVWGAVTFIRNASERGL